MSQTKSPKGLGEGVAHLGLDALFARAESDPSSLISEVEGMDDLMIRNVPIGALIPGKFQPRAHMDQSSLVELGRSLRLHGMVQPLVVRALGSDRYEIIAGERRWRAAKLANFQEVPVHIQNLTDQQAAAVALIENIQRVDLNAVDQAKALKRLIDEFELTHQEAAHLVGKSRASVSNLLRLLQLDDSVLESLASGQIEMGHARALLGVEKEEQGLLLALLLREKWTVRITEDKVRIHLGKNQSLPSSVSENKKESAKFSQWAFALKRHFSVPVSIRSTSKRSGAGQLVLRYRSEEELERLYDLILKK